MRRNRIKSERIGRERERERGQSEGERGERGRERVNNSVFSL